MRKWLQKKLIRFLIKDLFYALTAEDILGVEANLANLKPIIRFKGKAFDPEQVITIKENAANFEKSLLWRFMENRIRVVSQEKMFPLSTVDTDLMFGKAMLYNLDIIKQVLKEIRDIKT